MSKRKEKKSHDKAPKEVNLDQLKQKEPTSPSQPISGGAAKTVDSRNQLLKALADLDNYKKLAQKEKEEIVKFSKKSIIIEMLPVADGLERAIEAAKKHDTIEHLKQGIDLVLKQFKTALVKFGVEEIDARNQKYDPNLHEAISTKESEGDEEIVLEQLHKGYKLNGRLIRPAVVIISKKKEA